MKFRKKSTKADGGLKILAFFIHRYRWGEQIRGDERGFLEKAKQFKSSGMTVYVLEVKPSLQEGFNESIYMSLKIPLELKVSGGPLGQVVTLLHLIRAVFNLSSKVHYDLIYAYNQDMQNVIPAYFLKFVSGKPMVIVFHLLRSKEMLSFKDGMAVRLKKGFSLFSALLSGMLDIAKRFTYQRADLYIATSHAVKNDVIRHLKVRKVVVAGNGVDASKFRPYDLRKMYDAAFLGRLHPQKGIEVLLRAWKAVIAKVPSAKLVLIGGGNENDVKYYKTLIGKLGLGENVEMKGFVPEEELVRLLNSSKLFIFPSLYEGFALAVAEAMACGLPCVISDIPALRGNYGEAAILVEPYNVEGFAEAVVVLLKDEKRRGELGKRATECVRRFDWEDVARKELKAISGFRRSFS